MFLASGLDRRITLINFTQWRKAVFHASKGELLYRVIENTRSNTIFSLVAFRLKSPLFILGLIIASFLHNLTPPNSVGAL